MKLSTALLCLDCETLTDRQICPGCGGTALFLLSKWLVARDAERDPSQEEVVELRRMWEG